MMDIDGAPIPSGLSDGERRLWTIEYFAAELRGDNDPSKSADAALDSRRAFIEREKEMGDA